MSVVSCRVYEDKIEIASDSITVLGYTQSKQENREWAKLWQINNLTVGSVGICEEGNLFHIYCTTRKPKSASVDAFVEFMTEFAEWKKKKLDEFKIKNHYIAIFEKRAFFIEGLFITEITKYDAIGAGMDFALAALYLGHDVDKATKVACELSIYCEEPIIKYVIKK